MPSPTGGRRVPEGAGQDRAAAAVGGTMARKGPGRAGRALRLVGRFLLVWILEALTLLAVDFLVPGFALAPEVGYGLMGTALTAAFLLALLNGLVRPIVLFVALPLTWLTLGFGILVINVFILYLTSWIFPDVEIFTFWGALAVVIVMGAINGILMTLFGIEDDEGFFGRLARRAARRRPGDAAAWPGRGLVMLEIDGLSCTLMRQAIDEGRMPTVDRLLEEGSHVVSPYDCGLPSQTSSCQAGIMYGDNWDIPAFRWYDKPSRRVISSSNFSDAADMDGRLKNGAGLLRGGLGVNNHASGDAERTLFVMSALRAPSSRAGTGVARDFNLFFLDPYLFPRTLCMTILDAIAEVFEAVVQRVRNVRPRVRRLHGPYPLVRAATNVLLRNLSTFMVVSEIARGTPAIYTTYVGYDEIAHHAGPASPEALRSLRGLDRQIGRVDKAIRLWAGRPYELVVLSDHGQSWGATFLQRYDVTLSQLFERELEGAAAVASVNATESSQGQTRAFFSQVEAIHSGGAASGGASAEGAGGDGKPDTVGRVAGAVGRRADKLEPVLENAAPVVVCCSGNLANVYFDLGEGHVPLDDIEGVYPGLVGRVAAHPGVGFLVGRRGDGSVMAVGAEGRRDLMNGEADGVDPLAAYGAPDRHAAQLARLASFPHAGDLIVVSTIYEDGSVAAFEELVGSHGGLGGLQTEATMLHPADVAMPEITNATDVFGVLDARRGASL
jgi:uncharacterized membrane protein YvlD (DUF360 family)